MKEIKEMLMFLQHHHSVGHDDVNDKEIGRERTGMQNIKIPLPFRKMWVRKEGRGGGAG